MRNLKHMNPKIGDYVLCEEAFSTNSANNKAIDQFIMDNIGQYIKDNKANNAVSFPYIIFYENIPNNMKMKGVFIKGEREMSRNEIKHFSKNKEELEIILNSRKYNL